LRPDLAALLAEPTRAVEVPVEVIPELLTAAAVQCERIGSVGRALLARLTGDAA